MLNNHQIAYLKGQANGLHALYQIGKNELGPTQFDLFDKALTANELIKISVLKVVKDHPSLIAEKIASELGADVVQIIGRVITIYRLNPQVRRYKLPQ